MKASHYVYYDRDGQKHIVEVPRGSTRYMNSEPIESSIIFGFMSKEEAESLPDYEEDYDVNGYMLD